MKRSLAAVAAVLSLGGCGILHQATPASTPSGHARSGFGPVKGEADIRDPCTLLYPTEVVELTGRDVTQTDHDDAAPGEPARFCQWQQTDGQLAVFFTRTTSADFETAVAEADPLGDAYWLNSHLYQLAGAIQIDVYTHGADEPENKATATKVAETLAARL